MTMHRFCYYAVCMRTYRVYMRVYMRTALYVCVICMRTTIMYAYNNYVRVQQLCTHTTIMYAYNNYVRVQQ